MSQPRTSRSTSQPRAGRRKAAQLGDMAVAINGAITDEQGVAVPAVKAAGEVKKPKASTRVGKKGLVLYVDPEVTKALRRLAALNNTDQQTLGLRGLELLFKEHGMRLPGSAHKAPSKA